MNLKNLSESELLLKTKTLVAEEKRLTLEILQHLKEIESRRLYAKLGRSSLFECCTKDLGYSSGAAYRRIEAMRLLKEVPKVEEKLKAGEVHLSTLASVRGFLKTEAKKYSSEEKEELIEKVANKSTREVEKIFLSISSTYQPTSLKDKQVQLTPEITKITFVADEELINLLDQVKAKMACPQDINPDYNTVFKKMAKLYLKTKNINAVEQKQVDVAEKANSTPKSNPSCTSAPEVLPPKKPSRYIPAQVQKVVRLRAQSQCEFISPITKQRCTATRALQFDHCKTPYAAGGKNTQSNLQLVCPQHNQWRAIQFYGVKKMEQYRFRT